MKINKIKSYCIHLKDRIDREENMIKELNYFTDNCEIFDAIRRIDGCEGTSMSFKSIIKSAKKDNLECVLIFEDDVKFTSVKSKEQFQKCIDTLPDNWDVLLGGTYGLVDQQDLTNEPFNKYIRKVGDFSSLHCVLFNKSCYDKILNHDTNKINHIDRYLGNLSKNGNLNVYLSYPMIAIQYNTFSDNCKTVIDYDWQLKKMEILK